MPKLGVGPIRRKELIAATISVIHESSNNEPTLAAISERAGLATSIINHYFKTKQKLLEETFRSLASAFIGGFSLNIASAKSPIDKINIIIDTNFSHSSCSSPEVVSAWLWFWARVPINDAFAEIEHAVDNHVVNEIKKALQPLMSEGEARDFAEGIMAIMYGFWLRFTFDPEKMTLETACRITKDLVSSRISEYQSSSAA